MLPYEIDHGGNKHVPALLVRVCTSTYVHRGVCDTPHVETLLVVARCSQRLHFAILSRNIEPFVFNINTQTFLIFWDSGTISR